MSKCIYCGDESDWELRVGIFRFRHGLGVCVDTGCQYCWEGVRHAPEVCSDPFLGNSGRCVECGFYNCHLHGEHYEGTRLRDFESKVKLIADRYRNAKLEADLNFQFMRLKVLIGESSTETIKYADGMVEQDQTAKNALDDIRMLYALCDDGVSIRRGTIIKVVFGSVPSFVSQHWLWVDHLDEARLLIAVTEYALWADRVQDRMKEDGLTFSPEQHWLACIVGAENLRRL